MKVKGRLSEVQSDIDFYLRVSSIGNIRSTGDLRKHFFKRFLKEEREQMDSLLKEKIDLELQKERELQEERENHKQRERERDLHENDRESRNNDRKSRYRHEKDLKERKKYRSERLQEGELETEELKVEIKKEVEEPQKDCMSYMDSLLDELFSDTSYPEDLLENPTKGGIEDSSETREDVDEDVDASYNPFNSKFFLDAVAQKQSNTSVEKTMVEAKDFVSHGLYLDDLDYSSASIQTEQMEYEYYEGCEDVQLNETCFVEHGVMLDELEDYFGIEDSTNEEDSSQENYTEQYLKDYIEESGNNYNIEQVCFTPHGILLDELDYSTTEEEETDVGYAIEEDELCFYESMEEHIEVQVESTMQPEESTLKVSTTVEESDELKSCYSKEPAKEDLVEVPKDIREFLRRHPNSNINFVLQYYPKKEVEKQIKLGRIYKKKGILMI